MMESGTPTGLFGGTFDPPTVAHLLIAEWVRDELNLSEVWFMPAWINPLKRDRTVTDPQLRLRMLRESLEGQPGFVVRDDEIRRGAASYTIDTLRSLQEHHPERRFTLILGADSVLSLPQWKDDEEILNRISIAAVVRPGWDLQDLTPRVRPQVIPVELPPLPISATLVRQRVRDGKSIRFLVPESVRRIIEEQGLYR